MLSHRLARWTSLAAFAAATVSVPTPAAAEWMQATTPHFIVYSDTSEAALRRQAGDLELFDATLRRFQGLPDTVDASHNKVTVFVVPTIGAVNRLGRSDGIAGFYVPRITGSVAFTPRRGEGYDATAMSPQIVLFHEYAHHFLLGNYPGAYPAWFSEGYAEFASTVKIVADTVTLGMAAMHRAYGLLSGRGLSAAALFAPPARMDPLQTEAIYGRGWLLTHYILFDNARRGQLSNYLTLLAKGTPSLDAAKQAFGDLKKLDQQLDVYMSRAMPARIMKRTIFPSPSVAIRPLTQGERALIDRRMISTRGVSDKEAVVLFAKARSVAAPYPRDAIVQGWLAEMAYDAGDDTAAEAAADAALAVDPGSSQALLYKARVLLRRAEKGGDPRRWAQARSWILKANRLDSNDAAALELFYTSFAMEGVEPTRNAASALYRAAQLVPQDKSVRFRAARQLIVDGDVDSARAMLRPLAFDVHAEADNSAGRLLAALDAGKTGPEALAALEAAADRKGDDGD